ncbi:MAG: FtsX-like permease family protein [Sarcina sp.]
MKKYLKNNLFLIIIYSCITFMIGVIIIFNVNSFDKTVKLNRFYSDESISFEISGDYSEKLSEENMKKIFSDDGNFMIYKEEIRFNLSGIYINGDYSNYLDILSGSSLLDEKYKNKFFATRGKMFWKYNEKDGSEYIQLDGENYEIIGIHNFEDMAWYEQRGVVNLTDEYLFSGEFPIAGNYVIDGENVLEKFNQIKKIIEENTNNLTINLYKNENANEILSFILDSIPIFMFMFAVACIFILNIVNITRNWFLSKLKVLGIMRAFGATKKDIIIFSMKEYSKQMLIGFVIGYSIFIIDLIIKRTIVDYSIEVLVITPIITLIAIGIIGMISMFIPLFRVLQVSPLEVMKFYGK